MESGTVAHPDRAAPPIPFKVVEGGLRYVSLSANSEHDREAAVFSTRVDKALHDEVHVCVSFCLESHAKEDVNGEA